MSPRVGCIATHGYVGYKYGVRIQSLKKQRRLPPNLVQLYKYLYFVLFFSFWSQYFCLGLRRHNHLHFISPYLSLLFSSYSKRHNQRAALLVLLRRNTESFLDFTPHRLSLSMRRTRAELEREQLYRDCTLGRTFKASLDSLVGERRSCCPLHYIWNKKKTM